MNPQSFVAAVRDVVREGAVRDVLEIVRTPPGRRPSKDLVELSHWYNALSDADREMVAKIVREAATASAFGLIAVLGGARRIDSGPPGRFELRYIAADGSSTEVSGASTPLLHELW